MNMIPTKVEITHKTIIFTVLFLIFLGFLYQIRSLILLLFVAIIMMAALNPLVTKLERLRIPRSLGAILIYLLIWAFISFSVASLVPPLIEQSSKLIGALPGEIEHLSQNRVDFSWFEAQLGSLSQNLFKLIIGIFNNILGLITFMVIVYYLIIERKNLHKYLLFIFGDHGKEDEAENFIIKLETKLGGWVRGQITLMIIIGIMTYIGLTLLGLEYAVPLAFLAGILEIIPNLGPTVAAIPAVLVALNISPLTAVATAVLYIVIQQLENQLIVPRVMSKAVGLSPLVVIFSLLVGFKTAGVIGAILSVPTVLLLEIIINDLYQRQQK